MHLNLPLFLTLIRLILSPFLIPILLIEFLQYGSLTIHLGLSSLFAFLSLTDFFDGFLARKYRQETELGYLLDPIADKFLLYSTLIALVFLRKIFYLWAIIFIGREFFVMALRQAALSYGFDLGVIKEAKMKTAVQYIYLFLVILIPQNIEETNYLWHLLINAFLGSALYWSIHSAVQYYLLFNRGIKKYHDL